MAILFDAPVAPDELTYAIRQIPVNSNLALVNEFPTTFTQTNKVRWGEITLNNATAKYRAFDGAIPVADRGTGQDREVQMAPFSNSLNMGEYERLQLEYARMGGGNKSVLVDAIYDDAKILVGTMHNRRELGIGQVLSTGKFTLNENGIIAEADFGVPAGNKVTAAVAWTNTATAKAADDLRAWAAAYRLNSGGAVPGEIKTSLRVLNLMKTNAQIVGEAIGTQAGRTRINDRELADWLSSEGLPQTITTYETSLLVDGVTTRPIQDDVLLLLPAEKAGFLEFRFGLSATALELVNSNEAEVSFSDGPGIVGVVEKVGPPYRQFTYVDAVGMPLLLDAKRLFIADVA